MDATTKKILVKAINLLKDGDKKSAVLLLANVLKKEPHLVQAWYLLGLAVEAEAQKIKAFEQALKLDPEHEKARNALAKLQTPPASPETISEPESAPAFPEEEPSSPEEISREEREINFRAAFLEEPVGETPPDDLEPAQEADFALRAELSAEPDQESEDIPIPGDEFALPDWMTVSSFDPSEYQAGEPDEIYEPTAEEIPEWAKMNPFGSQSLPESPEPQPEPEAEISGWAGMVPGEGMEDVEGDEEPPIFSYFDDEPLEEETEAQFPGQESDMERVAAFFEEEDARQEIDQEDQSPGAPDWLRGMVDEEEDSQKKRRRKQLTPSQKRERRKLILRILLALLIIGATAAGYIYRDELKPYWQKVKPFTDKVVNPVQTFAAPVTDLLTQGAPLTYLLTPDYNITPTVTNTPPAQPTAEPTWTPQATNPPPTATLRPTLRPGETPTLTPTVSPLPNEIITLMQQIESQVVFLRGLGGPAALERELLQESKLRQDMENQLINTDSFAKLEDDLIVFKALGFIRDDVNMADPLLNFYADANGGFYSPETEKIYLIGSYFDGFGALEQYVYALVFAHAIQDNNFNLSNLGYFPECKQPQQTCQAMNALVKGEAALVNQLWLEQNPPQTGLQDILNYDPSPTLFGPETPAPFFTQDAEFGPAFGLDFVTYLYENGGWSAVNRAFTILPSTTEQIMHPEKYQQREEAGGIAYPNYTSLLGQEWELVEEDSLGEWYSYLLLGYNDYPGAQVSDTEAAIAASGWSVDRYQVFYNPEEQQTFLSVYWIWDSAEEGNQFYSALEASLNGRFGGAAEDLIDGGKCWSFGGERSCIQQQEQKVYWLFSQNADLVDLVRERFKVFP
ncbi:MAG: hypothetical protein JW757_11035 [Anaerolineales bacterium]|nr:hypothetical protein [Anaerolineales bacterium]